MFNIEYLVNIPTQNTRTLKINPLTLVILFLNTVDEALLLNLITQKTLVKTLILSPFHYKTSKKNIVRKSSLFRLKVPITFVKKQKLESLFFITNNDKINFSVTRLFYIISTSLVYRDIQCLISL